MTGERFVFFFNEQIPEAFRPQTGGKAWGLYRLTSAGIPVPPWAVLTGLFFSNLLSGDPELLELANPSGQSTANRLKDLAAQIRQFPFPPDAETAIHETWKRISGNDPVAVRSSASDEDGAELSFAGQMETVLNVSTREHLLNAVRHCWASLYEERAVAYRLEHGINPFSAQAGVIIQKMVSPDSAGVVFTSDPVSGSAETVVVSGVWGLGEGLVSGILEADTFTFNRQGRITGQSIASKEKAILCDGEKGTVVVELPPEKRNSPCLSLESLKTIVQQALAIEALEDRPMDIEFAVEREKLWILQARPVTAGAAGSVGSLQIWDNSNIVESYCGVTTPLTFSFIKRAYTSVYWQFARVIGVDEKTIFANRKIFENMLGLIRGRVYYNLLNWYRLVAMMPGFEYNKGFMEQMMGLKVSPAVNLEKPEAGRLKKMFVFLPRLARVALKMVRAHLSLPARIEDFHRQFRKVYSEYAKMDFSRLSPEECLRVYRDLEDRILWKWKAPIINDFEAMIFYGLLKSKTQEWCNDHSGNLYNDLLCGEGNISSTEVVTGLQDIAGMLKNLGKTAEDIASLHPEAALEKLRCERPYREAAAALAEFLDRYGVRAVEEMKLESVPMRENPLFVMATIQNFLRLKTPTRENRNVREREIRLQAEKTAFRSLGWHLSSLLLPRRWIYQWIVKNTRAAVRNRENQRFARTQAYSLVRGLMRSIGHSWTVRSFISQPDDIFYLTLDEIISFIEGTAVSTSLDALIRQRRKEFQAYREGPAPPDHLETRGEVYGNDLSSPVFPAPSANGNELKGLGCCQGFLEGEIKVVERPDSDLKLQGEIMVARQTDPGWTVLFPLISGLIVEKGSMLSHSAIVAREMGIPCIVGVKNAMSILKDGDRIAMNGASGQIRILGKRKIA